MNNKINTAGGIVIKNNAILFIKKMMFGICQKEKLKKATKKDIQLLMKYLKKLV